MICPEDGVKFVTLIGFKDSLEDLILDLQNEYPEWFVTECHELVDGRIEVYLCNRIMTNDKK